MSINYFSVELVNIAYKSRVQSTIAATTTSISLVTFYLGNYTVNIKSVFLVTVLP